MSTQPVATADVRSGEDVITVRPVRLDDVDVLAALAIREIGANVADKAIIRRVLSFNAEATFTVLKTSPDSKTPEIVGFSAHLLLNTLGLEALIAGRFNDRDPSLTMLCPRNGTPAALFGWGVVARGIHRIVGPMVGQFLAAPRYRRLDFYSRGATPAGVRSLVKFGAVPVHPGEDPEAGCLMVVRSAAQQRSVA